MRWWLDCINSTRIELNIVVLLIVPRGQRPSIRYLCNSHTVAEFTLNVDLWFSLVWCIGQYTCIITMFSINSLTNFINEYCKIQIQPQLVACQWVQMRVSTGSQIDRLKFMVRSSNRAHLIVPLYTECSAATLVAKSELGYICIHGQYRFVKGQVYL